MILYFILGAVLFSIWSFDFFMHGFFLLIDPVSRFWLLITISLTLAFGLIFFLYRHLAHKKDLKTREKGLIIPVLIFFTSIIVFWLYQHTITDIRTKRNTLSNILKEENHYYKSPISAMTGIVDSVIGGNINRISFDLRVRSIFRENQEVKVQGRIKVFSFDFGSFSRNTALYPGLGKITFGSEVVINKGPLSLERRFAREKLSSFKAYLAENGYDGVVYLNRVNDIDIIGDIPDLLNMGKNPALSISILKFIDKFRYRFWSVIQGNFSPDTATLLRGLLLGDSSSVKGDLREAFRKSGTLHLLAASGLHLTLLFSGIFFLFRFLPFFSSNKTWIALMLGLFYLGLTGFKISIIRAYLLALIPVIGNIGNRKSDPRQSLALCALIILIWDPSQARHVGFQLSFAAVLGILWFFPPLKRSLHDFIDSSQWVNPPGKWSHWLSRLVTNLFFHIAHGLIISFTAGIGASIIIWIFFNSFQVWSIYNNVIIVPIGSLLVLLGFLFMFLNLFLPGIFLIPLKGWITATAHLLTQAITTLSNGGEISKKGLNDTFFLDFSFVIIAFLPLLASMGISIYRKRKFGGEFYGRVHFVPGFEKYFSILPFALVLLSPLFINLVVASQVKLKKDSEYLDKGSLHSRYSVLFLEKAPAHFTKGKGTEDWQITPEVRHIFMGRALDIGKSFFYPDKVDLWIIPQASAFYLKDFEEMLNRYPDLDILMPVPPKETFIMGKFLTALKIRIPPRGLLERSKSPRNNTYSACKIFPNNREASFLYFSRNQTGACKPFGIFPANVKINPEGILYTEDDSLLRFFRNELERPSYKQSGLLGYKSYQIRKKRTARLYKSLKAALRRYRIIMISDYGLAKILFEKVDLKILYTGYESKFFLKKYFSQKDICFVNPLLPLDYQGISQICFGKK